MISEHFSMFNVLLMITRLSNYCKCIKDEFYVFSVLTCSVLAAALLLGIPLESEQLVFGTSHHKVSLAGLKPK